MKMETFSMGFKSQAQRAKFQQMLKDGKITQGKYNEWEQNSPKNLPDRLRAPQPKNAINALPNKHRKTRGNPS